MQLSELLWRCAGLPGMLAWSSTPYDPGMPGTKALFKTVTDESDL